LVDSIEKRSNLNKSIEILQINNQTEINKANAFMRSDLWKTNIECNTFVMFFLLLKYIIPAVKTGAGKDIFIKLLDALQKQLSL
jgi:hypothetical protein